MSIFTQPSTEISYQDVVYFCEQRIGEGVNLDYKKDFPPSGLEKTILAFANTFGGVILIGIEDEDSKPKPPFEGIEYKDGLEERVWNIIVDNIYPPVFPEIRVCPPHNNKTFVIIRVPQSNETPHAIYNNTQVYVRTGNRNKPEDLVTIEQIEWLRNRRKKPEELRELLCRRAEERYQTICEQRKVRIEIGEFTLSFVPLYPQRPLLALEAMEGIIPQMTVFGGEGRRFPWLPGGLEPVQDGMVSFFLNKDNGFITHTEINKFGLIYYKECLLSWNAKMELKENLLHMVKVIRILDTSFEAIGKYYNMIGFWGLVDIRFSLARLLGIKFIPILPLNITKIQMEKVNIVEQQLSWHLITSAVELKESAVRQKKLLELGKDIAWSFGFETSEEAIKQRLKAEGRWTG